MVNKIPKHKPNQINEASDLRLQTTNSPADTYCAHKYFLVLFLRFVSVFYSYKNFFFFTLLYYCITFEQAEITEAVYIVIKINFMLV